jgi:hypothetical protein
MQPSDFSEKAPGRPIRTAQDYWAFVPQPLPPAPEIDWDLANTLSEADRSLSELSGVARTLPNPHLLIAPFVRREAVLSSRIEGTQAGFSDLIFFEAAPSAKPPIAKAGLGSNLYLWGWQSRGDAVQPCDYTTVF